MIVPKKLDIITHEAMLDAAVLVHKVYTFGHKWTVKGEWINQGCVNTYPLHIKAKFDISAHKLQEWMVADDPDVQCVRYGNWSRLI